MKQYVRVHLLIALAMVLCCLCLTAQAAQDRSRMTVTVLGKKVTVTAADIDHYDTRCQSCGRDRHPVGQGLHECCWQYAKLEYKKLWGVPFAKTDTGNLLRDLPAAERKLTAGNLARFFAAAPAGSILRVDKDSNYNSGDLAGHSLIFLKAGKSGGWFWEGNYDRAGHVRIHYWTWKEMVRDLRDTRGYGYVKYILCPDVEALPPLRAKAPVFTVDESVKEQYPSVLRKGQSFGLRGIYKVDCGQITAVSAVLKRGEKTVLTFSAAANTWFDVNGTVGANGKTLNQSILFYRLEAGSYSLQIELRAACGKLTSKKSITHSFTVQ